MDWKVDAVVVSFYFFNGTTSKYRDTNDTDNTIRRHNQVTKTLTYSAEFCLWVLLLCATVCSQSHCLADFVNIVEMYDVTKLSEPPKTHLIPLWKL